LSSVLPPKKKPAAGLPVSSAPAGTPLAGLNYIKGKNDPEALPEEDYPPWLWQLLEKKAETKEGGPTIEGDEFCMSCLLWNTVALWLS
jgi:large subunit ribosomal protein L54